MNFVMDMKIFG